MKISMILVVILLAASAYSASTQIQGVDAQGWYDGKIYVASSHANYGGNATLSCDGGTDRRILFWLDMAAVRALIDTTTNVADSVVYEFYCSSFTGATYLSMYELRKPYKEGSSTGAAAVGETDESCWDHQTGGADSNWTSTGANSAADSGAFTRTDGTGKDRASTAESADSLTAAGEWLRLVWSGPEVDSCFRNKRNHWGWIAMSSASTQNAFYNSEEASNPTLHPKQTVYYHSTSSGSTGPVRYKHGPGGHATLHSAGGSSALHKP